MLIIPLSRSNTEGKRLIETRSSDVPGELREAPWSAGTKSQLLVPELGLEFEWNVTILEDAP